VLENNATPMEVRGGITFTMIQRNIGGK